MNVLRSALALLLLVGGASAAETPITSAQRKQLQAIAELTREAGALYTEGKYPACGEKVLAAQRSLGELLEGASAELIRAADPLYSRIGRAHALLELEGVVLPPLVRADPDAMKVPSKPSDAAAGEAPPAPKPPAGTAPASDGISFAGQIAPILAARCGGCHIDSRKGNFSLASFAALMQGPPEGVVIFAGDPVGSRLVDVIETGDMPRGGGRVSAAELQRIKQWITEGARFDGPAPGAALRSYAAAGAPPATEGTPAMPEVRQATGSETVSFAQHVAPLLLENCSGCHIDAMQTRGGLRMDSFAALLRGGDSGAILQPGSGAESLLVKKLRGEVGTRMPAGGRPALADEQIELISTWIDEGATLDAANPEQPLRVLAARAWAESATHEELAERRRELALAAWQLGNPGSEPKIVENDDFLILAAGGQGTLEMVTDQADRALEVALGMVPGAAGGKSKGKPRVRGRATLFVFPRRYDYSEFGKMIERRSLPSEWQAHWRYDGVDAYVALVAGAEDEPEEIRAALAGQLTSLLAAQSGDVPRWLSEGLGRVAAARTGGSKAEFRRLWDDQLQVALAGLKEPEDLTEGRLPPEQADALSYGIGQFLTDRTIRRRTDQLFRELAGGAAFPAALQATFGIEPPELVTAYLHWQQSQRRRR